MDRRDKVKFYLADLGPLGRWGRPLTPFHRGADAYAELPWQTTDGLTPDLILVDGRYRVYCILKGLINLPDDADCTFVLDDFASRESYRIVERFTKNILQHGRSISFNAKDCQKNGIEEKLERYRWGLAISHGRTIIEVTPNMTIRTCSTG